MRTPARKTAAGTIITGMADARTGHAAAPLGDDTVLIVGGTTGDGTNSSVLQSAEIFDPASGVVTALASGLGTPRTPPRAERRRQRLHARAG